MSGGLPSGEYILVAALGFAAVVGWLQWRKLRRLRMERSQALHTLLWTQHVAALEKDEQLLLATQSPITVELTSTWDCDLDWEAFSGAGFELVGRKSRAARLLSRFMPALHLPPGTMLASWLTVLCGKRVYRELLEQHVVDHYEAWVEAHAAGQLGLARWIRVRCWMVLLWSVMGSLPLEKVRALLVGESGGDKKKRGADD